MNIKRAPGNTCTEALGTPTSLVSPQATRRGESAGGQSPLERLNRRFSAGVCWREKNGFTLIEVLITAAVIAGVATLLTLSLWGFRAGQRLAQQASLIGATLRDAQQRSISGADSMEWGVNFINSTPDRVELFKRTPSGGGGLSVPTTVSSYALADGIEFEKPSVGEGFSQIAFLNLSGIPTPLLTSDFKVTVRKVGSTGAADKKTVSVKSNGAVSEQ